MNATERISMATISTTFDSGAGFSNEWALLTLNAPPPSPDISLIDSHGATGPPRMVSLPPATVETSCAPLKLAITPGASRMMATTTDSGSRMRSTVRTKSTQKLPSSWTPPLRESANQHDSHAHPHRCAGEPLNAKTGGQSDMRESGLAGIVLPAGVRGERDRGIESQGRCHPLVAPGPRQKRLQQQNSVQEQDTDRGERQQRGAVPRPSLYIVGLCTDQPIDRRLNSPSLAVGVHACDVIAKRHMENHHKGDDGDDLQPGLGSPVRRIADGSYLLCAAVPIEPKLGRRMRTKQLVTQFVRRISVSRRSVDGQFALPQWGWV